VLRDHPLRPREGRRPDRHGDARPQWVGPRAAGQRLREGGAQGALPGADRPPPGARVHPPLTHAAGPRPGAAMPQKRPLAVVVIAVLQLVFGAVSLCGAVTELSGAGEQIASVSQVNVPGEAKVTQQDVLKYWRDNLPSEWAVERISAASGVVLSL